MQLQKPEPLQHPPLPVDALVTLEVGGGEVSQLSVTLYKCHSHPMGAKVVAECHYMSHSLAHVYMHYLAYYVISGQDSWKCIILKPDVTLDSRCS